MSNVVMRNVKAIHIVTILVAFFAGSVHGRPQFVLVDPSIEDSAPSKYGYTVESTANGDKTDFFLTLNTAAAGALLDAKVFFHSKVKDEPSIKVHIEEIESGKTIKFSVSTKHRSHCVLSLDSGPVDLIKRPVGTNPIISNFAGYRLVLHTGIPEQGGTVQPATATESNSEGKEKP